MNRRLLGAAVVTSLVVALVGGNVAPATAAPVLANDTQSSGAGYAFGANDKGQVAPASASATQLTPVALPSGGTGALADAVSIAGGLSSTAWVDHAGAVWGIGDNTYGQRGNGTTSAKSSTPVKATGFGGSGQPRAVKVASYGTAVFALDSNGALWQWGQVYSTTGSLTTVSTPSKLTITGASRIIDVSAGNGFAFAMDDAYRVYSWGLNSLGQLGLGTTTTTGVPTKVTGLPTVASGGYALVEAGRDFGVYAVTAPAGGVTLYTWGQNGEHQLGNGSSTTSTKSPALLSTTVAAPARVLSMSAGTEHTVLLTTDGIVRTWGDNELSTIATPSAVADPGGVITGSHHPYQVVAGDMSSFAVSTDGTVAAWGVDSSGQLGKGTLGTLSQPTAITIPGATAANSAATPVLLSSERGQTYAVVDPEVTRGTDSGGFAFSPFSTTPASGQTAPSKTFTLTNVSTRSLTLTGVVLDGANPDQFTLGSTTCTGTLNVDASCTITVSFTPTRSGTQQAGVILRTSNTAGGLQLSTLIPLTGRGYTPVAGIANLSLDLASGAPTSVSGPGNVIPVNQLDPALIPSSVPAKESTSLTKIPLVDASLTKIPFNLGSLTKISLTKIPVGPTSLTKIPLSLSLTKIPFNLGSLTKISLTKIPLNSAGGWTAILQDYPALKDRPLSTLTLADLLNPSLNQPGPSTTALPLDRVTLENVDLPASFFKDISAVSFLMGGTRLDQYSTVSWCSVLPTVPNGGTCNDGLGLRRVLLDLDLSGIDPSLTGVGAVRVDQIVTDAASSTSDPLADAVFPYLTLGSMNLPGTHPGRILLSSLPNLSAIVQCSQFDCTNLAGKTLADVPPAQFQPQATYRDLGAALGPITVAQLVEPLLDRGAFNWELLDSSSIPPGAYPNKLPLQLDVDVNCAQSTNLTLGVTLPSGFRYIPGTTTLTRTRGTGTVSLADPTTDASRGLVVSVPDSSFAATGPLACTDDSAHVRVSMSVLPTSTAGSYTPTADARATGLPTLTASQRSSVTVTGVNQPPDDTPDGPLAPSESLVLGTLTSAHQQLYVPFLAPAGKDIQVTIVSESPNLDVDGVLFHPKGALVDPALTGTGNQVPFGEAPLVEGDDQHNLSTVYGGAVQDIPLLSDRPVAAVMATRGTDTEQGSVTARSGTNGDSRYVLALSGYNRSVGSFRVRIHEVDNPTLGPCTAPAVPTAAAATTTTYSGTSLAPTDNTLVVVDRQRLAGRYPNDVARLLASAQAFAGGAGNHGQVLQVDSDPGVQSAYAAWNAAPCDPIAADGVVRAINALIASVSQGVALKYTVLLGGDEMIPHARLEDRTRDANERDEAADLALNGANPIASSLAAGYYLSDDPYGTDRAAQVLGQVVYVPQRAVGRLAETAATMADQLDRFVATGGVADPTTGSSTPRSAVVTDYDFLSAGGTDTAAQLQGAGYAVDHALTETTPAWGKGDLTNHWLGKSPLPGVAVLNMHYDQYRGLPADGNKSGDTTHVYSTADVGAGPSLDRRVVYTVGCHSGLDVPDAWSTSATAAQAKDFAQAYAEKGLAGMVGNLGFGYADTSTVAYSAKLQSGFTADLASKYDLGTALDEAKRSYLLQLAGLSGYDLKSAQEMVLWGLPQYRLSSAAAAFPAAPAVVDPSTLATDPATQLPIDQVRVTAPSSSFVVKPQADGSSFDTVNLPGFSTVAVSGHPVLPATFVDLKQAQGLMVRSVVPTALTSDASSTPHKVTFARAMLDRTQDTEPTGVGSFPSSPVHVGTALGTDPSSDSTRSTLVVTPESISMTGVGVGTVRRDTFGEYTVFYGPKGQVTPPTIGDVDGTFTSAGGGITSYRIDVTPAAGRTVKRAFVLALPESGSGAWERTELLQQSGTGRWTGARVGRTVAFYVVAIDDLGDAALSTAKGDGYRPNTLSSSFPTPITVTLNPTAPTSGWFTSPPSINLGAGAPAGTMLSIDGGAPVPSGSKPDGDGVHTVQVVRPDGSLQPGVLPVLVDSQVPKITLTVAAPAVSAPLDGTRPRYERQEVAPVTATVVYGASGQASLTPGSVGLDTSTVGRKDLVETATSVAGLSASKTYSYSVIYGQNGKSFGFANPVLNLPLTDPGSGLNLVLKGQYYEFGYHLGNADGSGVTSGAVTGNAFTFTPMTCPSSGVTRIQLPKIVGPDTVNAQPGSSAGDWHLDTQMAGATGCYTMTLTANDGYTTFSAAVQIT